MSESSSKELDSRLAAAESEAVAGSYDTARAILDEIERPRPTCEAQILRARIAFQRGELAESVAAWSRAVELDPASEAAKSGYSLATDLAKRADGSFYAKSKTLVIGLGAAIVVLLAGWGLTLSGGPGARRADPAHAAPIHAATNASTGSAAASVVDGGNEMHGASAQLREIERSINSLKVRQAEAIRRLRHIERTIARSRPPTSRPSA